MSHLVSFVSSGPGDPELLTLKALKRIQDADVILFDDLSSGPILEFARPDCDLIGVGKRAGQKSPKQGYVSQLLVEYAQSGAKTIRLKSGDCGLFGRLEEEIIAVKEAGLSYEIIPGVPSPLAAAAAAGIPLTRRLSARRVQFITGHDVKGQLPDDFQIDALADPNATTVIFMGKRTLTQLATKLFAHGYPRDMPALLAQNVSKPDQSIQKMTLEKLAQNIGSVSETSPAIIMIGPLLDV